MPEAELERLARIGNRKSILLTAGAVILMAVSSYGTLEIMTGLENQAHTADLQKSTAEAETLKNQMGLKIQSLENQLAARNTRLEVLEGEFLFGGSAKGTYTEKELRLRDEYLAKKEAVLRARTLPILIAQIDELRPRYKNSQWEKKKIPDLPESKIMAQWFYETGREVDINPMILIAVAWTESRFRPDVCHGLKPSKAGAIGCMQIMPFHVARFDFIKDVKHLANSIEVNILTGGYVLREYLNHRYAEEAPNRLMAALRLYNYGPTNYGSRMKKKAKFNSYAENVIKKAEMLFDLADPFREKFDPENDPAKFLLAPLALNEIPAVESDDELY